MLLTLHNKMYCRMNFLSILVATLEKDFFLYFKEYVCRFSAVHELQSTALDSDYGLLIGYQMPADNYKGLNACFVHAEQKLEKSCRIKHPFRPVHEL